MDKVIVNIGLLSFEFMWYINEVRDMLLEWLEYIAENECSDLHLKVGSRPIQRKNTILSYFGREAPVTKEEMDNITGNLFTEYGWKNFEKNLNFDLSYEIPGKARFRVNISKDRDSYTLAARYIPKEIPGMKKLGLPNKLKDITEIGDGLILITGATGNGKSTTVASMLNYLNQRLNRRIYTLEDPIEYEFEDDCSIITQRELGRDMVSFDLALKYVLRQDPDIIFVGEMRDKETVEAAIRAAETGHLVIATLHTRDTTQTIDRIIDIFPSEQQGQIRGQLSNLLQMVISQQLMPSQKGGMTLACEILINTPAIGNLIREGKVHQIYSMVETGGEYGMKTFEKSLEELAKSGHISLDDKDRSVTSKAIYKDKEKV
jgi:twitching motility protein PilT